MATTTEIVTAIDEEINRLQRARTLLAEGSSEPKKRGRKPGWMVKATSQQETRKKKRILSPEARKRIGDAMRKRWRETKTPKGKMNKRAKSHKMVAGEKLMQATA